jgi:hypothetical protein
MNEETDERAKLPARQSPPGGALIDENETASVSEQLLIMKREIDLLQIEVAKPAVPWYKQIPILVSIGALLLALVTAYYSEHRSSQQALHDARVELRQLIVQIHEVSQELTDLNIRYRNNPTALRLARDPAAIRQRILIYQAADIADQIAEAVTPAEYYAVGTALWGLGTSDPRVIEYYKRGIAKGTDPGSTVALHRALALAYFGIGNAADGRKEYENALATSSGVTATRKLDDAGTQMMWATSELYAGQCPNAREHFNQGRAGLRAITSEGGAVPSDFQNQLTTLEKELVIRRC